MQLQDIFLQIVNMSLMAAVIIVAILGIRLLMKRAPKVFSYMLWLVVLFRLLCPVSFSTELSVFNAFDLNASEDGRVEFVADNFVYVEDTVVNKDLQATSNHKMPVLQEEALEQDGYIKTELIAADIAKDGMVQEVTKNQTTDSKTVAMGIWLAGVVVLMTYSAVQMLILRRNLIGAVPYKENIYYADHISTPFVLGVIRPRIYVPSSVEKSEWDYIIMHERHHIRRGDHIVRILAFLALCVHWFNPLVWIAFIQSGKDMEMSCDEAVMRQMKQDIRAEYSESLLRLATGRRYMTAMPLSFGEGDTKGRVKNVMRYKKPTLWVMIGAVVLCVIAVVMLASNPLVEMPVISETQFIASEKCSPGEKTTDENGIISQDFELFYELQDDGIGINVQMTGIDVLWGIWAYYYPTQEDQEIIWNLLKNIQWTIDDENEPWLDMKEIGWKIIYNNQSFMVFEGGYVYLHQTDSKTGDRHCFGRSTELCDMIQQQLEDYYHYWQHDISEIKNITEAKLQLKGEGTHHVIREQIITDSDTLALLEKMINEAEYIYGGVDCESMEATLHLTYDNGDVAGNTVRLALATDGSPVFAEHGRFYNYCPSEYRESGDWSSENFFQYFSITQEVVLEQAEKYVEEEFNKFTDKYSDWRIENLTYMHTYEDFNGMKLQIFRVNYEFLAIDPSSIELVGGMSMDEEGWVVPGYPNSKHIIFEQKGDELVFLTMFGANDCYPGDEIYTSDLQNWWNNRNKE